MLKSPPWKRHGHGEAGEDEARRVVERVADRLPAAEGAGGEEPERAERALADEQHHHRRQRERHGEVDERARAPAPPSPPRGPASRRPVTPAIMRPTARSVAAARGSSPDDPAAVHHEDAVGEREDLVELDGHEEHGRSRVPQRHQAAVDQLDGADVHAARGLADEEEVRAPVELAGEDDLLLIAAREAPRSGGTRRPAGCRSRRPAAGSSRPPRTSGGGSPRCTRPRRGSRGSRSPARGTA